VTLRPLLRADPVRLGAYTLLGRLATGGMGRIYLGRSAAGDLVAVKTLLTEGVADAVDRRRFAREVKVARRVHSPHTVRVLDADVEAERPWMAIEYVPAPSLAELVRVAGPPGASTVRWIAAGGAAALCTLHSLGVEHRDLKPQNILLPADGVKIIDFGISHATDHTRTQLTLGTIAFTSPEQARGEPSTPASDVYSLGVTLFHTATGHLPYAETEDPLRLLAQVARGAVDLSGLPSELVGLIRPCLSPDPENRPDPAALLPGSGELLPGPGRGPGRLTPAAGRLGRSDRRLRAPGAAPGHSTSADATHAGAHGAPDTAPAVRSRRQGGAGRPAGRAGPALRGPLRLRLEGGRSVHREPASADLLRTGVHRGGGHGHRHRRGAHGHVTRAITRAPEIR